MAKSVPKNPEPQPELPPLQFKRKRTSLPVDSALHHRLKVVAAARGVLLGKLADQLLEMGLREEGA
ncbi:MAG: hypothetical protein WBF81_01605 [Thermoplasmata archaeon]